MNHFFCTIDAADSISNKLYNIFQHIGGEAFTSISGLGNVHFYLTDTKKPLKDIYIKDPSTGSWLALIGTPLVPGNLKSGGIELIRAFFKDPLACLTYKIDGHFALIAFDASEQKSFLASDINSFIPVFYSISPKGLIAASSELRLARALGSDINEEGLWQAVNLGATWGSLTRFKGVEKLKPHELIIYRKNKVDKLSYWKPEDEIRWNNKFEESVTRWKKILRTNVESFVTSANGVPVSADLTGGEDSRLIVAQCENLQVPFTTRVAGFPGSKDIEVATRCAESVGLTMETHHLNRLDEFLVADKAMDICLTTDGYGSFFSSGLRYNANQGRPPLEYRQIHLCGMPGGEVYRGSYYLRAKLLIPSRIRPLNERGFVKLTFLLDHQPGLFLINDNKWKENVYEKANSCLKNFRKFPVGIQVDHLLRLFDTSLWGLTTRYPFYLPLGLKDITRSIYQLKPEHKKNGRLTRAVTEDLFPELASLPTTSGAPTLRWRPTRDYLFWPGYWYNLRNTILKIRLHLFKNAIKSESLGKHRQTEHFKSAMLSLLNSSPYSEWFGSSSSMLTGAYYRESVLNPLLENARKGKCKNVLTLGRIINQELSYRYISAPVHEADLLEYKRSNPNVLRK